MVKPLDPSVKVVMVVEGNKTEPDEDVDHHQEWQSINRNCEGGQIRKGGGEN